jgi:hypothetical protein
MSVTPIDPKDRETREAPAEGDVEASNNGNGNGGGKSLEEIAGEEQEQIAEEESGQLAIAGTVARLNTTVGGNRPTVSVAKIKALKLPVRNTADPTNPGQFEKGDTVRAMVDLVCVDISFPDERRKGTVERTQRVHVFEPLAIEVVPVEEDSAP